MDELTETQFCFFWALRMLVKFAEKCVDHTPSKDAKAIASGADLENEIIEYRFPPNGGGCSGPMGFDVSKRASGTDNDSSNNRVAHDIPFGSLGHLVHCEIHWTGTIRCK